MNAPFTLHFGPIGQVFRRTGVQDVQKRHGIGRDRHIAAFYDLTGVDLAAIELLVRVAVRAQRRTLERHPGKEAPGARVGQDLCPHDDIRGGAGVAPFRTGGGGSVGSELHLAAENG